MIDHINNNREDNRLCNLQMITQQENCKKSAKGRDHTFVKDNYRNKKCVKATNCDTNEVTYYNSMYSVQQHLRINVGIVKMVCDKINHCKTGISKKDNYHYKFEYVNKEDVPDNHMKLANECWKRLSDEEKRKHQNEAMKKWKNKEYACSKCDKTFKNSYKYAHNKRCK